MHVHLRLWRHMNVHFVCLSSCECFCILSAVYSVCLLCCWMCCVLSCAMFILKLNSILTSLCVCFVCVGRYCRSSCSCCISCKEHEPPGNAQKHQHWWHQHKSAKFTVLQIVATRSWACRCQPVFTLMQCVYQNFKLLLLTMDHLKGTVWFDTAWFVISLFSLKKKFVCFCSQITKSQYLFITETFLLPWWGSALDI